MSLDGENFNSEHFRASFFSTMKYRIYIADSQRHQNSINDTSDSIFRPETHLYGVDSLHRIIVLLPPYAVAILS